MAYIRLLTAGLLLCALSLHAQVSTSGEAGGTTAAATTNDAGPAGIVPFVKGFNASLGTSSQHDSSDGWSSLLTPDIAYRFNRRFSADAGTPLFAYINVLSTVTKAQPIQMLQTRHLLAGDTALNGHYETQLQFARLQRDRLAWLAHGRQQQRPGRGPGDV